MPRLTAIYTAENCKFSHPLNWVLSVFWREPAQGEEWLAELCDTLRRDGINLRRHRFSAPTTSQFVLSSHPRIPPAQIVQRLKGRLQYAVRKQAPKALKRNFALRSFGKVTRDITEGYVADQLGHHPMADPRVQKRLTTYRINRPETDLSEAQTTSHGVFWHCLHIVLVHRERWRQIDDEVLSQIRAMILKIAYAKHYLLSEVSILPDHIHFILGCPFDQSPEQVALGLLNNLAFVHGMRPVFQFGGYIGTVGGIHIWRIGKHPPFLLKRSSFHGDKPRWGGRLFGIPS